MRAARLHGEELLEALAQQLVLFAKAEIYGEIRVGWPASNTVGGSASARRQAGR
jgi:hypothetical protein